MFRMTNRRPVRLAVLALPLWLLFGAPGTAFGQSGDQSFGWYADLVSVDQASGSVTVRAPFLEHVANYIDNFSAGDEVVVVWTQLDGEADAVLYVESPDVMQVPGGYIVHANFVEADLPGHTVTFTVPQATTAVTSLASADPGTPIRIESPIKQPEQVTAIASVALNERPPARPEPDVEEKIVAKPDGPLSQIAGDWKIEADIMGNAMVVDCTLMQSETELSGTCAGPPAQVAVGVDGLAEQIPVTGTVQGNTVKFSVAMSFAGNDVHLEYSVAVAESGTLMEGSIDLMGMAAAFTGSKQ
jgi:hypothetical protein